MTIITPAFRARSDRPPAVLTLRSAPDPLTEALGAPSLQLWEVQPLCLSIPWEGQSRAPSTHPVMLGSQDHRVHLLPALPCLCHPPYRPTLNTCRLLRAVDAPGVLIPFLRHRELPLGLPSLVISVSLSPFAPIIFTELPFVPLAVSCLLILDFTNNSPDLLPPFKICPP